MHKEENTDNTLGFFITYTCFLVALDFSLVCKHEHVRDHFEEDFPQWAHAINSYCKDTQIRSSALQQETADYSAAMDDGIDTTYVM